MKRRTLFSPVRRVTRALVAMAFLVAGSAVAAPLERDLGLRLSYVRVHQLPEDLPPNPAGRLPSSILDVRYVQADAQAATALAAWVKARAGARSPVFVLANTATSAEILRALAMRETESGIVLVGIEAGTFKPDISVRSSAAEERRAYDALEKGAEVAALLADNPTKVRHDEASLTRDRPIEPLPEPSADRNSAKSTAAPIDAALQRAVHLHRSLVALKKL